MARRTHARFVTTDLGAFMAIEQGGQILANEAGADINRMARASQEQSDGSHYVEVLIYGDGSISNSVSVGVATGSASLSTYVGGDSESFGYRGGEGEIHTGGSASESGLDTVSDGDIIGVVLDAQADTVSWYLNGGFLTDISITSDKTWHLAVSLAGTDDADLRAFLNSGQRAFQHDDDPQEGWYNRPATIPQIRLSSDSYMTASDDSPPNTAYDNALDPSGLVIEREIRHWPSGDAVATANISEIPILNHDGRYDDLVTKDVRDLTVWIRAVEEGEALSTAERVFTGVVDRVRSDGDGKLMLSLRDPIATFDKTLQRKLFLPNAEEAANAPLPIGLGAVRTIEPVLVDQSNNKYRISDAPVSTLGDVRDEGALLDPSASTPDFTLSDDRQHIELQNPPNGKLTVEYSSLGDASTEGQTDLWGGIGDPFADADDDGDPDGWDVLDARGSTTPPEMNANFAWVDITNEYLHESWMADTSLSLEKGKTYKLEYRFNELSDQNSGNNGFSYIDLTLDSATPGLLNHARAVVDRERIEEGVTHKKTFTVPSDWDNDLIPVFYYEPNNQDGAAVSIDYLAIFELPDAFAAADLDGMSLEQFLREILENRANKDSGDWSSSDAATIDSATGYEIGWYTDRSVSVLDAILDAANAWGISYHTDPDGVLRITRLEDPADVSESSLDGEISDYNLLAAVEVQPDVAEGLTTAMAGRRNWKSYDASDFADTSFTDANQATRRVLMRDYQETVTTGADLPGMYSHADLSEPVETLIDNPSHAQEEISRIVEIYSEPRWIYVIEVPEPAGTNYQIGQVLKLTYDQHGLSDGKQVLVLAEEHNVFDEWARLVVWG